MPERSELRTNDNCPIPILRRAPVLLDNHWEMLAFVEDVSPRRLGDRDSNNRDSNLRRSISHRISRVARTTLGRNLSESLRRSRSASPSQSRVQGGAAGYRSEVRIRKVHGENDSTRPFFASDGHDTFDSERTDDLASTNDAHSARAHELAMSSLAEIPVPALLQQGVPMTKVSAKSQKSYLFKLDADQGQIIWESKRWRIIPIENIKELRSGSDARYYRQQFQLAREYEDRWITIIYMLDGQYKTLHLIASSLESFQLWDITLRKLYAIRQELMTGLGNEEIRQAVWVRQCWKSTGEQNDQRLSFDQVEKLCRRLNINSSLEDLVRLFDSADSQNRQYLDFADFQTFVKLLKARPEIDLLYKKLCLMSDGRLTFNVFECFVRDIQKSSLTLRELENLFVRYSTKTSDGRGASSTPDLVTLTMSMDAFTAFLVSSDNSALIGQNGKVYQPMTHPLSDYFISSSHNTYLVGHQLVGYSTIEGYIRALLRSCRSVELDIYDGESEPMVFHGKTLTSKVSAREVCEAVMKYAFVTSPYPIIISAEIHCSLPQQEMLAMILHDVFGKALVSAPIEGKPLSGPLPSPEDLKGRVLLKAKNLYVSKSEPMRERHLTLDTESSSTEASASDSDVVQEIREEPRKVKLSEVEVVKAELKEELRKARNVFNRVRGRHSSPERSVTATLAGAAMVASTAVVEQPPKPESKPEHKAKMSPTLVALLVYTVGVKCHGINKKEHYAPEHMFSLSETTMNKILRQGAADLIKHNKTHLVRVYPKGTRVSSTNYLPHRCWAAGAQLVAINWQTFDLGYMINHAMFQRNGRAGYVLKPEALRKTEDPRKSDKEHLHHHTQHYLEVTCGCGGAFGSRWRWQVISAQQLPRPKDAMGHEIMDKHVDPYVEVSVHSPDWNHPGSSASFLSPSASSVSSASSSTSHVHAHRSVTAMRTSSVKNNGFNPMWQETLRLPFECLGDMRDLIFVRFTIQRDGESDGEPIAVYCISLGSLAMGEFRLVMAPMVGGFMD
ncbi:phosphoinositide-specific phospholipase C [Butyriboletus roseoflavus]|nr:phosphoinositide-specific phospholipase C [Butyriboletus roseoflavus]